MHMQDDLEDRLRGVVLLARVQHHAAMEDVACLEEEARFHWDSAYEER